MHFVAGGFISFVSSFIADYNTSTMIAFLLIALLPTIIIGGAKEIIYDKFMKKGTPEWMDFIATVLGGILTTGIMLLIL